MKRRAGSIGKSLREERKILKSDFQVSKRGYAESFNRKRKRREHL